MKSSWNHRISSALLASIALVGCSSDEVDTHDLGAPPQGSPVAGSDAKDLAVKRTKLPIYNVVARGASAESAKKLEGALALGHNDVNPRGILEEDGSLRYHDVGRFQRLPMKPIEASAAAAQAKDEQGKATVAPSAAVDIDALKKMQPMAKGAALARAEEAFEAAGLSPKGEASTSHAVFESRDAKGELMAKVNIDTHVSYEQRLEGLRLIGPGAKVKAVFDAEGAATQLMYAAQELERGEEVAIVPLAEAEAMCASILGGGEGLRPTAELVYYAPPLAQKAERLFPHYACGGTKIVDGSEIELRRVLMPATVDAPKAAIHVTVQGSEVRAEATVEGGTAPYTFAWGSSTKSHDRTNTDPSKVAYTVVGRTPKSVSETVSLLVTDANGLTFRAAEAVKVSPALAGAASVQAVGGTPLGSVGTEWVGTCGGLGGSAANAAGFVSRFQASGIGAQFNWGEYDAWEIDFKDPTFGGQDQAMADNVDLVFYTGHAGGDGFTFCSSSHDGLLHYSEAKWGESNLEWLAIAACGPLQEDWGGVHWINRWGPAFQGLHLLLGYATISYDNTIEGNNFADYMLRYDSLPVRQAWINMAMDAQWPDVIWAEMGVWGPDWTLPNYDDYFWGMGATGPDTSGADIVGYWRISGPS